MNNNNGFKEIISFSKDETTLERLGVAIAEMKEQSNALLSDIQSILNDIEALYS